MKLFAGAAFLLSTVAGTAHAGAIFDFSFSNHLSAGGEDLLTITPESPTSVPEPATALLLAGGLLGIAYARHRKLG